MNREEIRQAVRDILGDVSQGFWKDDELNRYIQLACNWHAQEGLSVPVTEGTTSLPGVQEYALPPYFGEMRQVRWQTDTGEVRTLYNVPKTDILNRTHGNYSTSIGEPFVYYIDGDIIGLYPIPSKKPLFSFEPTEDCQTWQTVVTERDDDDLVAPAGLYSEDVFVEIEDACNIYISHVSLTMRRNALPIDGAIQLEIKPIGRPSFELNRSRFINVRDLGVLPEWVHFDFTHQPVELIPGVEAYRFMFQADGDFHEITRAMYRDEGPEFAVERQEGAQFLYFQFHEFRQDLEMDFYKNEVGPIETDGEDFEVPNRYHRTIIKKAAGRALRKGGRDVNSALIWDAEAEKEVKAARAQAVMRTRGKHLRTEGASRLFGPDATIDGDIWRIRPW